MNFRVLSSTIARERPLSFVVFPKNRKFLDWRPFRLFAWILSIPSNDFACITENLSRNNTQERQSKG